MSTYNLKPPIRILIIDYKKYYILDQLIPPTIIILLFPQIDAHPLY